MTAARAPAPAPSWAAPAKTSVPDAVKPTRLEYASWWRQWGAVIVDGVGAAAAAFGVVRLTVAVFGIKPSVQGLIDVLHDNVFSLIPLVVAVAVGIAVWHLVAVVVGATIGQRLFGLRLVNSRGRRPAAPRLVVRALVAGLGGALFLASPLYALLLDGRRRGFGDIVARTVAIRR